MSNSNNRVKSYCTYHHLMSRIAHRVYFMTAEVRNDFLGMILRTAKFCGIKLVAWCIMANHFHILAYLPEPEDIDEMEILRRYGALKGMKKLTALKKQLALIRSRKDDCEERINEALNKIKAGMYDIGMFMKIVKQWLTQKYNKQYSHMGTLWESVYKDVPVKGTLTDLAKRSGYIHLNPIRAAITPNFADYPWSSFTALCKGDETALSGMRLIYGDDASKSEIEEAHANLMSELLEQIKLERALDVAQKRKAGFDPPADPLTDEALIAQATAHIEKVMKEAIKEKAVARTVGRPKGGDDKIENQIRNLIRQNPTMTKTAIATSVGISRVSVYAYLRRMNEHKECK